MLVAKAIQAPARMRSRTRMRSRSRRRRVILSTVKQLGFELTGS